MSSIKENQHLINAYIEYMQARKMKQAGLICNVSIQRENLRTIYRLIAGKELKL